MTSLLRRTRGLTWRPWITGSARALVPVSTLVLACLAGAPTAQAQETDEEAAVVAAVERLFEAMRTSDSTMARAVFHETARLGRAQDEGITFNSVDGFIAAIGSEKDQVWDEPIWDWTVHVDGRLAQMWTKYAFYLGEAFSHCGVDAIELYRSDAGWQITQLVDTNRRTDCWYPAGRDPGPGPDSRSR